MNVSAEVAADGSAMVFLLEWPGACGWGPSLEAALAHLNQDTAWEQGWLRRHGLVVPPINRAPVVTEVIPATGKPLKADTEGFYAFDRERMAPAEAAQRLRWAAAAHADLIALGRDLSTEVLERPMAPGKRSPAEAINHVAIAAWWYLSRLPGAPELPAWQSWPDDPLEKLAAADALAEQVLHAYVDTGAIHTLDGETWSARKVARRLSWHGLWHLKQFAHNLDRE